MSRETDSIPKIQHRHISQQEGGVEAWLMSYADMITLLLCFFVIFVSVSEPKRDKFSQITEGLVNRFGTVDTNTPLRGVFESMQKVVESHQVMKDIAVERTERGVAMEISSRAFFQPGSAELDPEKMGVLVDLVTSLKTVDFLDYNVIVEGHTSDEYVVSTLYATNWELSSARAARMARYFIDQGIKPDRLRAVAFSDTQPKVPNLGVGGQPILENREKNDRVVIKLERVL